MATKAIDNILRLITAIAGMAILIALYPRIRNLGNAALYTATWVTFLHVCIGEYVFVKHLNARSYTHNLLDIIAAVFLFGAILSLPSPALWCSFFSAFFAIAIVKYMLIKRHTQLNPILSYTREKIRLELPVVIGMSILAVILGKISSDSTLVVIMQIMILLSTIGFAIWMINIRHIYRDLINNLRSEQQ